MEEATNDKNKVSGGDKVVISWVGYSDNAVASILIILQSYLSQKKKWKEVWTSNTQEEGKLR